MHGAALRRSTMRPLLAPASETMSGKAKRRAQKKRAGRDAAKSKQAVQAAAAAPSPPSPEALVGAIVEAIAAPLLEDEPQPETSSGVHPASHAELRAHPRVTVAVAIGLESESHFFSGLSGDISEGGVFVQTYRDLPVGSDVDLRFELPEGELKAHGRVRWHRANSDSSPPGLGIAFERLDDDERRMIQQFCEHRAPLYYDIEHAEHQSSTRPG
jgi:uncharacterized protein (TIGR02266 family)